MISILQVEAIKLRRSLIVLLALSIPAMLFLVTFMGVATGNSSGKWALTAQGGAAIWAYFLLPMTATALTALMAQLEHGAGAWSYMLALAIPRWKIFLAKALLAFLMMGGISVLCWIAILGGAGLAGAIIPAEALEGHVPYWSLARLLFLMWGASLLLIAIQFLFAMQFQSFAVPVVLGIGGTFIAVVATSARLGVYFPWLLPTNILAATPERMVQALSTGAFGGLVVMVCGLAYLSRRDWR